VASNADLFTSNGTVKFSLPATSFRESINLIEGKTWFELDVSNADTIVIVHEDKSVVIDKKDFLQKVGLEW